MNRFLIPAAVAALVVGCARPAVTGSEYSAEPYYAPPETTVIVREVHYQEPVVYTDTVYMAAEPAPVQPVYVQNDYNEYNEYNETNVYVRKQVTVLPQHPGGSRGSPRDRPGYDKPRVRRNPPTGSDHPAVPVPKPPVKKTLAPVTDDRQNAPVPPAPPYQPVQPKRQAPAPGGSTPAASVQNQAPKQASTPPVDNPAPAESDAAQMQVGKASPKIVSPVSSAGQRVVASPSQLAADGR
jgi:hypothetical protein